METIQIDQIGLAMCIVALFREHVKAISGSWTTLLAIAVCVGVYFGAPHIPQSLYVLIASVVGPMGAYAGGKQLLGKAGTTVNIVETGPPQSEKPQSRVP